MQTTIVHITHDLEKLLSCEAFAEFPPAIRNELIERFKTWLGDPVKVFLPPLPKPTGIGKPCSSKWFWRIAESDMVDNAPGAACFCEHMLDLD